MKILNLVCIYLAQNQLVLDCIPQYKYYAWFVHAHIKKEFATGVIAPKTTQFYAPTDFTKPSPYSVVDIISNPI
jgi:hypothetical protein